jgi:hypothetical protein
MAGCVLAYIASGYAEGLLYPDDEEAKTEAKGGAL